MLVDDIVKPACFQKIQKKEKRIATKSFIFMPHMLWSTKDQ